VVSVGKIALRRRNDSNLSVDRAPTRITPSFAVSQLFSHSSSLSCGAFRPQNSRLSPRFSQRIQARRKPNTACQNSAVESWCQSPPWKSPTKSHRLSLSRRSLAGNRSDSTPELFPRLRTQPTDNLGSCAPCGQVTTLRHVFEKKNVHEEGNAHQRIAAGRMPDCGH
jgi:hypothetical protein